MPVTTKICGLNDTAGLDAALAGGAAMVGFVFYPPSPRALTPQAARPLADMAAGKALRVGLLVDAPDETIAAILEQVPLDWLQLHGKEPPARVAAIRAQFGLPVMKAVPIATAEDVARAETYVAVADQLLFDAKPPPAMVGALPGGNAVSFDWTLLAGRSWAVPWMLSGGLHAGNVAQAVRVTGTVAVDVSSGVETRPGLKDPARITAFLAAVAALP